MQAGIPNCGSYGQLAHANIAFASAEPQGMKGTKQTGEHMSDEDPIPGWSPDLSIDQGLIDADHQYLFNLTAAFMSGGGQFNTPEQAYDLVHRLVEYASIHFRREEALLARINYPDAIDHHLEHIRLEDGLAEIQKTVITTSGDQLAFVSDLMGALINEWLVTHIRSYDLPMRAYVEQLRQSARNTPPIDDLTLL